jgi:hypothetical protein
VNCREVIHFRLPSSSPSYGSPLGIKLPRTGAGARRARSAIDSEVCELLVLRNENSGAVSLPSAIGAATTKAQIAASVMNSDTFILDEMRVVD